MQGRACPRRAPVRICSVGWPETDAGAPCSAGSARRAPRVWLETVSLWTRGSRRGVFRRGAPSKTWHAERREMGAAASSIAVRARRRLYVSAANASRRLTQGRRRVRPSRARPWATTAAPPATVAATSSSAARVPAGRRAAVAGKPTGAVPSSKGEVEPHGAPARRHSPIPRASGPRSTRGAGASEGYWPAAFFFSSIFARSAFIVSS
jgi:hypothetical protein